MRGKKWLLTVVCALLLVGVVCVLGNWLIDPFGVFEASPLQWDSYAQTLNPRGSKVRYISERPGESETEYIDAVRADAAREAETFAAFGIPAPDVISFPEGAHADLTDVVLRECGYKVTLTTDESRVNTVVVGLPQTLIDLGRMTVLPGMTDEQLLQYLNERAN